MTSNVRALFAQILGVFLKPGGILIVGEGDFRVQNRIGKSLPETEHYLFSDLNVCYANKVSE